LLKVESGKLKVENVQVFAHQCSSVKQISQLDKY